MKKNHNSKNHDPANQCVTCGNEMPEGDHVCKLCREQLKREVHGDTDQLLPDVRAENEGGHAMSEKRYPTRMHEILMEEREMTPEERLLKEMLTKSEQNEMPDDHPETYLEKADYAMFCMHKALEHLSPALVRASRLCGLLRIREKDGKNTLPRIITHNESRKALRHLIMVKRDVDDAYQEILSIFESTNTKPESVGQGPEPGGEGKS